MTGNKQAGKGNRESKRKKQPTGIGQRRFVQRRVDAQTIPAVGLRAEGEKDRGERRGERKTVRERRGFFLVRSWVYLVVMYCGV